jgi:hypothetical protein
MTSYSPLTAVPTLEVFATQQSNGSSAIGLRATRHDLIDMSRVEHFVDPSGKRTLLDADPSDESSSDRVIVRILREPSSSLLLSRASRVICNLNEEANSGSVLLRMWSAQQLQNMCSQSRRLEAQLSWNCENQIPHRESSWLIIKLWQNAEWRKRKARSGAQEI